MFSFNPLKVFAVFAMSIAMAGLCLPDAARSQQQPAPPPAASTSAGQQAGVYLLMQLDTDDLFKKWMEMVAGDLRQILRQEKIAFSNLVASKDDVRVTLAAEAEIGPAIAKFKSRLVVNYPGKLFGLFSGSPDMDVIREGMTVVLKPTQAGKTTRTDEAVNVTVETLNLRVNPDGTKRIRLKREGTDRISLEAPGVTDAAELKNQIGRGATLGFHLVDVTTSPDKAAAGSVPPGSALYKERRNASGEGERSHLLYDKAEITGADIAHAAASMDRDNRFTVDMRLSPSGARRFALLTQENVGRPLAIVLNDEVISAPVIREAITGGSLQISGNFTAKEADTVARLIRSSSLPAKLNFIEERSLGGGNPEGYPR